MDSKRKIRRNQRFIRKLYCISCPTTYITHTQDVDDSGSEATYSYDLEEEEWDAESTLAQEDSDNSNVAYDEPEAEVENTSSCTRRIPTLAAKFSRFGRKLVRVEPCDYDDI